MFKILNVVGKSGICLTVLGHMADREKTSAERMRELIDIAQGKMVLHEIDEVYISKGGQTFQLSEGRLISGRFTKNIRIDNPTYGAGQTHAHIHGRRGDVIGIVNFNGTASHGTKCILHPKDAAALRAQGFQIPDDRIVEWVQEPGLCFLLEG